MAERELDDRIVIDQSLIRGGLVELVSHVDALGVVEVRGREVLRHTGVHALDGHVLHVAVVGFDRTVPPRRLGHVIDERVGGAPGGVDLAVEDASECAEAGMAGAGAPDGGLDLLVSVEEAELHWVGAVDQHDDVVEVPADHVHQVLFGLGELEVVFARLEVLVCGGVGFELGLAHVGRQVVLAFAGRTGERDDRHVGECLGTVDQLLRIGVDRGFGQ